MDEQRLKALLDEKLDSFKRELTEDSKVEREKLVKRIKPTLRRRGNQTQLDFNLGVKDTLEEAKRALRDGCLDKAVASIEEGIVEVDTRNKLIQLADSSACGWATVNEYQDHALAEDSDDEKRIRRAEAAAERKKRQTGGGRRLRYRGAARPGRGYYGSGQTGGEAPRGYGADAGGYRGGFGGGPAARGQPNFRGRGPCYGCGLFGHIRRDCKPDRK